MHETLESRIFLSGTVDVEFAHGRLFITGDAGANQIIISAQNDLINISALAGTSVTGKHRNISETSLSRGIVVTLNGGDDSLNVSGHIIGDLTIDTGDGDDSVTINNTSISNSMLIKTGAGDDNVNVSNSSIHAIAQIEQDGGVDPTTFSSVHVGQDLKIDDLIGNAQMSLSRLIVDGKTIINTGNTSDGVAIHHSTLNGDVTINTAAGNDNIFISDSHLNRKVNIDPGTGKNDVRRDIFVDSNFSQGNDGWTAEASDLSPAADKKVQVKVHSVQDETGFVPKVLEISSDNQATLYLKKLLTTADGIVAGQLYNVQFAVNYLSNRPASAGAQQILKVGAVGHVINRSINPETGAYQVNIDHGVAQNDGADTTAVGTVNNNTRNTKHWVDVSTKLALTQTVRADSKGRLSLFVGTDPLISAGTDMRFVAISVKLTPAKPFDNLV